MYSEKVKLHIKVWQRKSTYGYRRRTIDQTEKFQNFRINDDARPLC